MSVNDEQPQGPRTDARTPPSSWTELQRREGPAFLHWLCTERRLLEDFGRLATALRQTLREHVPTASEARDVWHAAPAVLANCNDPTTYTMAQSEVAYTWLHMLDRYVRTWLSLERLVSSCLLPMAKYGVRVLDVGTGPGPSAFATHDFYAAMLDYSRTIDSTGWRQPPEITCVEPVSGMNHIRHAVAERVVYDGAPRSVLCVAGGLHDFSTIVPTQERREMETELRNRYEEYYDDQRNEWHVDPIYTREEANLEASTHRRYRPFTCSNFLTTLDSVRRFETNFKDILVDAKAGSVLLLIGAKGGTYPAIQDRMAWLAKAGGFRHRNRPVEVAAADARCAHELEVEIRWFYRHLTGLAGNLPANGPIPVQLRRELESDQPIKFGSSAVCAFRKSF